MIRIERLELSNFKSFRDVTIDFHDVNVIVGANASGKSNLLSVFQFLEDIHKYDLTEAINKQGGKDHLKNFKADDNHVIIQLHFNDGSQKAIGDTGFSRKYKKIIYRLCLWIEEDFWSLSEESFTIETEIWKGKEKILELPEFELSKVLEEISIQFPIENIANDLSDFPIKLQDIQQILSPLQRNVIEGDRRPTKINNTLLHLYGDYLAPSFFNFPIFEFVLYFKDWSSSLSPTLNLNEDGTNISSVIEEISKNVNQKKQLLQLIKFTMPSIEDIGVELEPNSIFPTKLTRWYLEEAYYLKKRISGASISDGTVRTIATILALFFSDYKVQFFEEPERNIHPSLISALMELIYDAGRKRQIFLTTHSSEIVRFTKEKDVIVAKRNNEGYSELFYPTDKKEVQTFLNADLNMASLYVDNLLESLR